MYGIAAGSEATLPPSPQKLGNAWLATPESGSVASAVTVKPPEAPSRTNTVVPVADAFVNEPNESEGAVGGLVSSTVTASSLPGAASVFPATSRARV